MIAPGSRSATNLSTFDSGVFAFGVLGELIGRYQRLCDHAGWFVRIGKGEAHANLEAGGAEDTAQRFDRR